MRDAFLLRETPSWQCRTSSSLSSARLSSYILMDVEMDSSPYIKQIEVTGLRGSQKIVWELSHGVNILSGINGSGKSTLLQALSVLLRDSGYRPNPVKPIDRIRVTFDNGTVVDSADPASVGGRVCNVDIVSTFDNKLKMLEALQKLSDDRVRSDLDWQLYVACERFIRYQLRIGKQALDIMMNGGDSQSVREMMKGKERFFDIVDSLLGQSGKRIVRGSDEISFTFGHTTLSAYQLSSGEKQLIIILTTVLTQDFKPYVLIMDEPEISLHFDWQKKLIGSIMSLNPNVQLIVSTHSPAMIMEGWIDRVSDMEDLIVAE